MEIFIQGSAENSRNLIRKPEQMLYGFTFFLLLSMCWELSAITCCLSLDSDSATLKGPVLPYGIGENEMHALRYASVFRELIARSSSALPVPEALNLLFEVNFGRADHLHALQEKRKRKRATGKFPLYRPLGLSRTRFFQQAGQDLVTDVFANQLNSQQPLGLCVPVHECHIPSYPYFRGYTRINE